jgi:hypothetical protein
MLEQLCIRYYDARINLNDGSENISRSEGVKGLVHMGRKHKRTFEHKEDT